MLTSAVIALLGCATVSVAEYTSPSVLPSPNTTGAGGWGDALSKAKAFLAQLTVDEKTLIVAGTPGPCTGNIAPIPRLNFSGLCLQDGPLAIRPAIYASVFSAGLTVAASWDRSLAKERGNFMGAEFKSKGAHIALGPVVGPLGRSPFGGRNWEGFSPDPYLSGELVEQTITGMQNAGVQACTKHYIGNEQETQRNPSVVGDTTVEAISANIDDKTIHETYLWPFANAIHAGSAGIMCSYNRINGSYGCQNSKTLNGLLKTELGFQGYVMSDWGATHSGVYAIQSGLDMDMPGGIEFITGTPTYFGANITTAINNGSLASARLDDMVLRVLTPYFALNQDQDYPGIDESSNGLAFFPTSTYQYNFTLTGVVDARDDHATNIRNLGAAGTVLLKNAKNALPLKQPKVIGVFGNDAADFTQGEYSDDAVPNGLYNGDYDIGTVPVGGGSGSGRFSYVIPPLDAIKAKGRTYGALVQYITSNFAISNGGLTAIAPIPDVCIVFLKSWAGEGYDRLSLVPEFNSTLVVENVAALCPNTVVVHHGASPNIFSWKDNPNVTAILAAHMPGQETGNSIVDILWGDVNPSGKLPYTIANSETDYARNLVNSTALVESTDPDAWVADFTEGDLIDYKEFDAQSKSVAFEFGFGLSYTTFDIADLGITVLTKNASRVPSTNAPMIPGGNSQLWETLVNVTATIKNTGSVSGATVPQLYISLPVSEAGTGTPLRSLRGFEKVNLSPGQSTTANFPLMRRDLSFWDTTVQAWRLPQGEIGVAVGFSSRDLPLSGLIVV